MPGPARVQASPAIPWIQVPDLRRHAQHPVRSRTRAPRQGAIPYVTGLHRSSANVGAPPVPSDSVPERTARGTRPVAPPRRCWRVRRRDGAPPPHPTRAHPSLHAPPASRLLTLYPGIRSILHRASVAWTTGSHRRAGPLLAALAGAAAVGAGRVVWSVPALLYGGLRLLVGAALETFRFSNLRLRHRRTTPLVPIHFVQNGGTKS